MTTEEILQEFSLPELPEEYEGDEPENARQLVIFRFKEENIPLGEPVSLADAQEYCSRDDTHGDGWFVGFRWL